MSQLIFFTGTTAHLSFVQNQRYRYMVQASSKIKSLCTDSIGVKQNKGAYLCRGRPAIHAPARTFCESRFVLWFRSVKDEHSCHSAKLVPLSKQRNYFFDLVVDYDSKQRNYFFDLVVDYDSKQRNYFFDLVVDYDSLISLVVEDH